MSNKQSRRSRSACERCSTLTDTRQWPPCEPTDRRESPGSRRSSRTANWSLARCRTRARARTCAGTRGSPCTAPRSTRSRAPRRSGRGRRRSPAGRSLPDRSPKDKTATASTPNAASGSTFAPAPTGASPALTAEQAWADYVKVAGGSTSIPSVANVQLGFVTWPSGLADAPNAGSETISNGVAYLALNELAYGYSEPSPCPPQNNIATPGESSAASNSSFSCIDWLFVDANTGQQIMETWQNVG